MIQISDESRRENVPRVFYEVPNKMFGGIDLKITVSGMGYVGLSIATLLSQHHTVMAVDILPEK